MLTRELNLKETTPTTLDALWSDFRSGWFTKFQEMKSSSFIEDDSGKKAYAPDSVAFWANQAGINVNAPEGLHSKLNRLLQQTLHC